MDLINNYKSFLEKKLNTKIVSGVVIIYDNKILLVHDTKKSKITGYGIPKGGVERNESVFKAARRELREETGIKIKKKDLDKTNYSININKRRYIKIINYYVYVAKTLKELGLNDVNIPKSDLQLVEIDDAKFMNLEESRKVVNKDQLEILDNLEKLNLLK